MNRSIGVNLIRTRVAIAGDEHLIVNVTLVSRKAFRGECYQTAHIYASAKSSNEGLIVPRVLFQLLRDLAVWVETRSLSWWQLVECVAA